MKRRAAVLALALAAWLPACVSDNPDAQEIDVYLHNAQGYMEQGHYDQALDQFRKAIAIDPSNKKALLGEVGTLCNLGMTETQVGARAIQEAETKIAAIEPENYGEGGWKVKLIRGEIHARLAELWGRKEEAARKRTESGEGDFAKDQEDARRNRARYEALTRPDFLAVLASVDQDFANQNITALFYLARSVAFRAQSDGEYDEALGYFDRFQKVIEDSKTLWTKMKKQEPDNADIYEGKYKNAVMVEINLRDIKATIHFKKHDHEKSIEELDKILALDPYRWQAFLTRAQNQEELGRFGAAADDYKRFLKFTDYGPTEPAVIEASERMARCEEKVREKMGQ
jgi:tetratricopeptide (TPR) repeat protein